MAAKSAEQIKREIDKLLTQYKTSLSELPATLVPDSLATGKLYEAWILCLVLEQLHSVEHFDVTLHEATKVSLKSSPGPINRSYPHFRLTRDGGQPLEVWTDVEFLTLGYDRRGKSSPPSAGDYHELDIVVVPAGRSGRPLHTDVLLGVECKNTGYQKHLLRGILGVRRELSYLHELLPTAFSAWPRKVVPALPASCLLVYCTDATVLQFVEAGEEFGVDFFHEDME